ncbi:amidohydrolase family protein [Pseudonocardia sp. RS010]|uniref:amidohydrolase family protein n=1 Tax=Pseudonocardia sp. RS010 TaxID=3385979 RepID=UPI0039A0747A
MILVTDVHTHYVPRGWPALPGTGARPALRVDGPATATIMLGERPFRTVTDAAWNAEVRLAHMDAHGVDRQVLAPTPVLFAYDQPGDAAARTAALFNDLALEIAAGAPGRLLPFCQVPLQDTDAACRELDRAVAAGHLGVEIGNHVGDRDLDDAGIVTFLQHAAALGVPVFVHPWDVPRTPRTGRWMAQWLAGMPAETHLSLLAMVLGGVFDRIGPELRICFAHGGGSFPFWVGRMDNAWRERHDLVGTSAKPPSGYLDRFRVDSVVFDERALRLLVDTVGVERVLLGTDYPYPLGERAPGSLIRGASFLRDDERALLLGGNAAAFLGLPAAVPDPVVGEVTT